MFLVFVKLINNQPTLKVRMPENINFANTTFSAKTVEHPGSALAMPGIAAAQATPGRSGVAVMALNNFEFLSVVTAPQPASSFVKAVATDFLSSSGSRNLNSDVIKCNKYGFTR